MIYAYCSICTETFNTKHTVSCLSCGHLYHNDCLKKWLIHKQNCPQCRNVNVGSYVEKIFFNENNPFDSSFFNSTNEFSDFEIKHFKLLLEQEKIKSNECLINNQALDEKVKEYENEIKVLKSKIQKYSNELSMTQQNIDYLQVEKDKEIEDIKLKMKKYRFIEKTINKESKNIQSEINNFKEKGEIEELCSALIILRKEFKECKEDLDQTKLKLTRIEVKNKHLEEINLNLTTELDFLKKNDSQLDRSVSFNHDDKDNCNFATPIKPVKRKILIKRQLSTPQQLLLSSPDTPDSEVKVKQLKEAKSANIFKASQSSSKPQTELDKLSIFENYEIGKTNKKNFNYGSTKIFKKGFF